MRLRGVLSLGMLLVANLWLPNTRGDELDVESQEVVSHIKALWAEERAAIDNVRILSRQVRRRVPKELSFSPDEVHNLIDQAREQGTSEAFLAIAEVLDPSLAASDTKHSSQRFLKAGQWVRHDSTAVGKTESMVISRRLQIVTDRRNQQITVGDRGDARLRSPRLEDFRWLPQPGFETGISEVERLQSKRLRLISRDEQGYLEVVVDEPSGFVHEYTLGSKAELPSRIRLQFDPWNPPNGNWTFARSLFEGTYVAGRLASFKLIVVDDIQLNLKVLDVEFDVLAEQGDTIIDRRGGQSKQQTAHATGLSVLGIADLMAAPLGDAPQ